MDWTELETTTHQDHVIKHVLGATVLGWFVGGDAAHLLLDIGFFWTIYLDGEMGLLPQGVAISELEGDEFNIGIKSELASDTQMLLSQGSDASGLKHFIGAPIECLVTSVEFFGAEASRRIIIHGETGDITITTSLETGEVTVHF